MADDQSKAPADKREPQLNGQPLAEGKAAKRKPDNAIQSPAIAELQLPHRLDRKYLRVGDDLFRSGKSERPDLVLSKKGTIKINNDTAIRDAVAIAKANGWTSIRPSGSYAFQQGVYLEARRAGLDVTGYKPTEQLRLEGERLAARDKSRERKDPANPTKAGKQDPAQARQAADEFRSNSHRANARDPKFKAAQTHVLAASIAAEKRFPKNKAARAWHIAEAKEDVAQRIEKGEQIQAVRFEKQRQNEVVREQRENLVLRNRQPAKQPTRSR